MNILKKAKKIRTKINFILFNVIAVMMISLSIYSYFAERTNLLASIETKLLSDIKLSDAYMEAKFPGQWQIVNGELHKGLVNVVGDTKLVDQVGEFTNGDLASIFQGNERVSTNLSMKTANVHLVQR